MDGSRLRIWTAATVVTLVTGYALAAFVAPIDANPEGDGFVQKILYLHVPMAIVALGGFIFGGVCAIGHLRSGDSRWDVRSYVAIHLSLVLACGVLLTGSIWARASWGHWWEWREPTLVSFLIVFLLYCTYQPLRFSIEDREKQSRYASVFAIVAGAFVPLNFMAVRLSTAYVHPRTLDHANENLPGAMRTAFLVCLLGMALLYITLWKYEMANKHMSARVRALRRRIDSTDAPPARPSRTAAPEVRVS